MKAATIDRLRLLNRSLYDKHGAAFSATRNRPWHGWKRIIPLLTDGSSPLAVLDVACGNGRFGTWLRENAAIRWFGIDSSAELLAIAQSALPTGITLESDVLVDDWRAKLVQPGWPTHFDVVASMGFFHHIPSYELRERHMRDLAQCVDSRGCLILSFWDLEATDTFRKQRVPWDRVELSESDLESGDHLLEFADLGLRYCHHADRAEQERLVAASGLAVCDRYGEDANSYWILAHS